MNEINDLLLGPYLSTLSADVYISRNLLDTLNVISYSPFFTSHFGHMMVGV